MRKKMMTLALILTLASAPGCATIQSAADTVADKTGMNKAGSEATIGAGLGAAAGAVVGKLTGMGTGTGAVIGGLFGAVTGYSSGHERDIKEAEALALEIRQDTKSEISPSVGVRQVKLTDADQEKTETYFQDLAFSIPARSLASRTGTLQHTLAKVGKFASTRERPAAIHIVGATKAETEWIQEKIREGYMIGVPRPVVATTLGPVLDEKQKPLPVKIEVFIDQKREKINGVA